jgi:hypothetical protein
MSNPYESPKSTEAEMVSGPPKKPSHRDHGELPDWETGDVPEPLPFSVRNVFKTIGPGAILLAASIGGGEWIVGPMTAVKYGTGILWVATVAIFFQMIFNLETIRYTLATGEPILTGFMRLKPGPKFWGGLFIVLGVCQLAVPALAAGCANVLFAAAMTREPGPTDGRAIMWITLAMVAVAIVLLLSGKSVEKTLERLSWGMIVFIMTFLLIANFLFVPAEVWGRTAVGFLVPQPLPKGVDIILLSVFAATAGSGGLGNLAISNWSRDKGLAMGKYVGGIAGALADDHATLAPVGWTFIPTAENVRRWRTWWYYTLIDQSVLWACGCVIGMYLNVNLALAIVPEGTELPGYSAGAFQANHMAKSLWVGFWGLALLNGFWILFSTQLGNMDCLARVVCDTLWAGYPSAQRWRPAVLYATLLIGFAIFGSFALLSGKNAVELFKILGFVANPILAISAFAVLRVNTRFLPQEVRPEWWRCIALFTAGVLFTILSLASFYDLMVKTFPTASAGT